MEENKKQNVKSLFFMLLIFIQISFIFYLAKSNSMPAKLEPHPKLNPLATMFRHNTTDLSISLRETIQVVKGLVIAVERGLDNVENAKSKDWNVLSDKMQKLNMHPIFKSFNIQPNPKKPTIHLLLIVSSAPKRLDRRTAIRETWWSLCKSNSRITVKCLFMTDYVDESTEIGKALSSEKNSYGDVEFQHLSGGVEFGKRYLYHLVWAMQNYNFEYFMRMDDDYFLCLDRFLLEIPRPVRKGYHWGWVHCSAPVVRPEESIILLSRDLVELFLGQDPNELYCHPWADQMVAVWVDRMKLPQMYRHDRRLHHHPPAASSPHLKTETDICHKYIGVHGSYPNEQRIFWEHRGNGNYSSGSLDNFSSICQQSQMFDWRAFTHIWRYEPKKCIENPVWDTRKQGSGKSYSGRQGT